MLFEFGGHTFAARVLEVVGPVQKSPNKPGDIHQVMVRTQSGFERTELFDSKEAATKAREVAVAHLSQS